MKKALLRTILLTLCLMMCLTVLSMAAMAADTVEINESNFPDSNFRSWLQSNYGNSVVISQVTEISVYEQSISDLTGVEYFTSLSTLKCGNNNLTSLDVSKNTALTYLSCDYNQLTSLDVSKNTRLATLFCGNNPLTSLNVSNNPSLTLLNCIDTQLTSLSASNSPLLSKLHCFNTKITSPDISHNSSILRAYVNGERKLVSGSTNSYYMYSLSTTSFSVNFAHRPTCLSISAQPADQTAIAGKTATFSVTANGLTLKYQWYVQEKGEGDWVILTGETGQELTITADKDMDGNLYQCLVMGSGRGETVALTSENAQLTVYTKPTITTQPKAVTAAEGKKATFTVKAQGENLTYQWQVQKAGNTEWTDLDGETGQTLTFTAAKNQNGCLYRCVVSNPGANTASNSAKLTVVTKPKITTQPKAVSVKAGQKVTFKLKASGGSLTYQWYYQKKGTTKWVKYSGKTKTTLSFAASKSKNGYKYRCLVKNKAGSVYSKAVKLTVK